jgi:hypothetical protein
MNSWLLGAAEIEMADADDHQIKLDNERSSTRDIDPSAWMQERAWTQFQAHFSGSVLIKQQAGLKSSSMYAEIEISSDESALEEQSDRARERNRTNS